MWETLDNQAQTLTPHNDPAIGVHDYYSIHLETVSWAVMMQPFFFLPLSLHLWTPWMNQRKLSLKNWFSPHSCAVRNRESMTRQHSTGHCCAQTHSLESGIAWHVSNCSALDFCPCTCVDSLHYHIPALSHPRPYVMWLLISRALGNQTHITNEK